jgi:F420-0:gamma-glutamyl ligase-like protein
MNLTPSIKAQAIAAAVYTTTGIQAQVIERPGQPPLVSFTPENRKLLQDFLRQSMRKKSDVEIDVLPIAAPLILEKFFGPAALTVAGLFLFGYLAGRLSH